MKPLWKLLMVTMAVLLLGFSLNSSAQLGKSSGVFKIVKGDVKIRSGRDKSVMKAQIGTRIYPSDTVITGTESRAKIEMIDKNELNISPSSEITIQKYEFEPAQDKKNVLLNVISGKVRSKVNQKYDGQANNFQVVTPSAVAGVRGTDFLTSYNPSTKSSQVVTFQGQVEWGQKGPNNTVINPVMVKVGQTSQTSLSAPPSQPAPIPMSELKKIDSESKTDSSSLKQPENSSGGQNSSKPTVDKNDGGTSNKNNGDVSGKEAKTDSRQSDGASNENTSFSRSESGAKGDVTDTESKSAGNSGEGKTPSATQQPVNQDTGTGRGPATTGTGPDTAGRTPSSAAGPVQTMPTGGAGPLTMLKPADLPSTSTVAPVMPIMPTLPPTLPTAAMPNLNNIPKCDFCNQIIQNGSGKANVKIHLITAP